MTQGIRIWSPDEVLTPQKRLNFVDQMTRATVLVVQCLYVEHVHLFISNRTKGNKQRKKIIDTGWEK